MLYVVVPLVRSRCWAGPVCLTGKMKRGSYIVNTARGKICDRNAVAAALESGQLAGYAGDVWFPQPAPKVRVAGSPPPTLVYCSLSIAVLLHCTR